MASFAEYESDVRADYTRANFRFITQQGRPFGGRPPYGYLYDRKNRTYRPHPQHADVVRFIFMRYEQGTGQLLIARELTTREIPTAGGLPVWQAGRIGRLLDNPAYAALLRLDGKFVAAKWEPLVSPAQWHRVAERRKLTREKWSRKRAPKRLLAGLVYCEDCGRKAYYTARGGELPGRYRCSRSNTVAPSHEQRRLRPLFQTLIASILTATYERASESGEPMDPALLVVLDEAANIAPLRDLDTLASTAAGQGIQIVSVFQDLAQVSARYGGRAATVINNHRAKVLLSGISDPATLEYAARLLGDEEVMQSSITRGERGEHSSTESTGYRSLAPAHVLRGVRPGEGVLVYGHLPPSRLLLRSPGSNGTL